MPFDVSTVILTGFVAGITISGMFSLVGLLVRYAIDLFENLGLK